jgi:hypothetical protein
MEELVRLDDRSFRSYQIHTNVKLATNQKNMCDDIKKVDEKVDAIKTRLNKRPEVLRANIAIVSTIITVVIAAAALIITVTGR